MIGIVFKKEMLSHLLSQRFAACTVLAVVHTNVHFAPWGRSDSLRPQGKPAYRQTAKQGR